MTKLKYLFFSALADAIHGIRYAFVPLLDWAWRQKDAAAFELANRRKEPL